jgi:hypothetical protein
MGTPWLKDEDWEYEFTCSCGCHCYQLIDIPGGWLDNRRVCVQCGKACKIRADEK